MRKEKQSVWQKFVGYLGFGPEEDDYQEEEEEATPVEEWPQDVRRSSSIDRRAQVVPITAATQKQSSFKVLVVEPRSFEEVQTIVDQMRARRPVILNLEALDKDLAQKILNFLNGAIYALGGETQRVAQGIFFFAPQGVDISTMGRGLTGTAIGGGAVDLPPGVLEKLTGVKAEESSAYGSGYLTREESSLLGRGSSRSGEGADTRTKFDWRNK